MTWQPADTAPAGTIVWVRQSVGHSEAVPFLMSRAGLLWFWEPGRINASVVPTDWLRAATARELVVAQLERNYPVPEDWPPLPAWVRQR